MVLADKKRTCLEIVKVVVFRVYLDLVNGSLPPEVHSFPSFERQNGHVIEDVVFHLTSLASRKEWRQHLPLRSLKVAQS